MQPIIASRSYSAASLSDARPVESSARPKRGQVFLTTHHLPVIITDNLRAQFYRSKHKAEPADMSNYFVISTEQQNKKRVVGELAEVNMFRGNEFLRDANAFADPKAPQVFHKPVEGYVGMDGHVYTPTMTPHEEEQLHSAMLTLMGEHTVNSVVALPVTKTRDGDWLLNVHRHQETEADWGFKQDFVATPGGMVTANPRDPKAILSTLYQELNEETGFTEPKDLSINGMMFDAKAKVMYFVVSTPQAIAESEGSAPPQAGYSPFFNRLKPNEEYADPEVRAAAAQGKIICAARQDGKFDLTMSRNLPLNLKDPALPLVSPEKKEGRGLTAGLAQDKMLGRFNMFANQDVRELLANAL
ncbi:hypothetical protein ACW9H6_24400 [Pseudomonas sp. SDO528_S397]